MEKEKHAERRIVAYPPTYVKQKIDKHIELYGGTVSAFIVDAVKEKLDAIKTQNIKNNSVSRCL